MAWCLFDVKPLLDSYGFIDEWNPRNNIQRKLNQNKNTFAQNYAFENVVCKMFQPQFVNPSCVGSELFRFNIVNIISLHRQDISTHDTANVE